MDPLDQLDPASFGRLRKRFEEWSELPREQQLRELEQLRSTHPEQAALLQAWLQADAEHTELEPTLAPQRYPGLLQDFGDTQEQDYWLRCREHRYGPYRLGEQLGRGGMGAVFAAERDDGQFEQSVAIKLLRPRALQAAELAGFAAERQMLARLSHPHIARLFDGGIAPDGSPYLVMERVDGEPITEYANRHRLGIDERLALLRTVCVALEYAHQQMIVHRDLKPANVLVSEDAQVKLLDFGVAGLLSRDASGTLIAPEAAAAYTPAYASPEQLRGEAAGIAADVHALGLLLHELLSGQALRKSGVIDPDLPPTPLSNGMASATRRAWLKKQGLSPRHMQRALRHGLDALVQKALAVDPGERYAHVSELISDLDAFREQLPLRALGGGNRYRIQCFLRRHRFSASLAGLLVLSVLASLLLVSVQALRIAEQRDRANVEAETSRQALDLLGEIFRGVDPNRSGSSSLSARQLLDEARLQVLNRRDLKPASQARLVSALGWAYLGLGDLDSAQELVASARELDVLDAQAHQEQYLLDIEIELLRGNYANAQQHAQQRVTELGDSGSPSTRARLQGLLVRIERGLSQLDAAMARLETALADATRNLGPSATETLDLRIQQIYAVATAGEFLRAQLLAEAALNDTSSEGNLRATLDLRSSLAMVLHNRGLLAEARALREQINEELSRYLDVSHPRRMRAMNDLAAVLYSSNEIDAAAVLFEQLLDSHRQLPDNPTNLALAVSNLAAIRLAQNELDIALALYDEAVAIRQQQFPLGHYMQAQSLTGRGLAMLRLGRHDDALSDLRLAASIAGAHAPGNLYLLLQPKAEAARAQWLGSTRSCDGFDSALDVVATLGVQGAQVWLNYLLAMQGLCRAEQGQVASELDFPALMDALEAGFGAQHERVRFVREACARISAFDCG